MSTTVNSKPGIDNWVWRGLNSPALFGPNASLGGVEGCLDLRNDISRDPHYYFSASSNMSPAANGGGFSRYNPYLDGFDSLQVSGTFPVGAIAATVRSSGFYVHQPSRGPRGTLAAGGTTSAIILTTALPTAVGVNALANRGDGVGYKIRIIGNHAGGSGKTEERYIIANTGGTTPTITVGNADGTANPFSFTPASGDAYEFLSGRVYNINSTAASSRSYDILTGTIAAIATANAPSLTTEACGLWLDEGLTPATRAPGDGFLGTGTYNGGVSKCLTATATAAGTITGQAAGGDAAVLVNEYRNFQIRIVEDTGTPTAVGQRRKITSHTVGASPIYTLATNWTVTPSATAKYVIEYANELLVFTGAGTSTTTYVSDVVGAASADTWSTATYAARGTAGGAGMNICGQWGAAPVYDLPASPTAKLSHASQLLFFRGGATLTTDLFDISGAATGAWTNAIQLDHNRLNGSTGFQTFTTGTRVIYDPVTLSGRYAYIIVSQATDSNSTSQSTITSAIMRYDVVTRNVLAMVGIPAQFMPASSQSKALWMNFFIDGTTKIARLGVFGNPFSTTNYFPTVPHLSVDLLN
jgi:hypothetical protein